MSLSSISVHQYKCFQDESIQLKALTLLTGQNAAGKSSALQPLLILAQTMRRGANSKLVDLNGSLVKLGTASEILNRFSSDRYLEFKISRDDIQLAWRLEASDAAGSRALEIKSVKRSTGADGVVIEEYEKCVLPSGILALPIVEDINSIIYLGAGRDFPRDTFAIPDSVITHADVGTNGEFASWWYSNFADEDVDVSRRIIEDSGTTLRRQVDAVFGKLFPGAQVNAELIPRTALARLTFKMGEQSEWLRPINVGFGLSYAFPLILALLLAKPGQIIMVDSPEAHLHPAGQSMMGQLISCVASAGVQIIVETHSDHILNGIRLATRQRKISPENIAIHYFQRKADDNRLVVSPAINKNGSLSNWPLGFFDQADIDLMMLTGMA